MVSSVQVSHSVMSNSLRSHEPQHARQESFGSFWTLLQGCIYTVLVLKELKTLKAGDGKLICVLGFLEVSTE